MEAQEDTFVLTLRAHLVGLAPDAEISPDVPLRELGLNSMRAIELLLALEKKLEISFPDDSLTDENFRSLATLQELVRTLIERSGAEDG